eukprot:Gb_31443 [translate_table: standard]
MEHYQVGRGAWIECSMEDDVGKDSATTAVEIATKPSSSPDRIDFEEETLLHFDGASKGNPGKARAGGCLYSKKRKMVALFSIDFSSETNNVMEFEGLLQGLTIANKQSISSLLIKGDSSKNKITDLFVNLGVILPPYPNPPSHYWWQELIMRGPVEISLVRTSSHGVKQAKPLEGIDGHNCFNFVQSRWSPWKRFMLLTTWLIFDVRSVYVSIPPPKLLPVPAPRNPLKRKNLISLRFLFEG